MRKTILLISSFALVFAACNNSNEDFTKYVDPFVGTGGHGHTFPGACLPFGMVQLSPDNEKTGWDWCSGYNTGDSIIIGFSHTHLSGTGCGDLQDVTFMPSVGALISDSTNKGRNFIYNYKSHFDFKNEKATPGYYSVTLDNSGILVELTATLRAGFHKYTFPETDSSKIIVDLDSKTGWKNETYIKIINDTAIEGYSLNAGWAANQKVYFAASFSKPFKKFFTTSNGLLQDGINENKGNSAKAVLIFDTQKDKTVLSKVGISSVNVEGAWNNLNNEIKGWDFDAVKKQASLAWNNELKKFKVESKDEDGKKLFYTALYHSIVAPNLYSDFDGKYTGMDNQIHKADGFNNYFTLSLWDTYRAANPLYTIVDTNKVSEIINGMLTQYKESGLLPVWTLWGNETNCMIGYHAVPVIADAYLKGIRGYDANLAYEAMKESAMQNVRETDLYRKYGFVPQDSNIVRGKKYQWWYDQCVSMTLEYAYDDWCIAQVAKAMGKNDDYNEFSKRANYYKNVADSTIGFMRPKNANGKFAEPFDPTKHGNGFTEGNSWQYSWSVQHDIPGLIKVMGGKEKFISKLDTLFYTHSKANEGFIDVSGLIGQYAQGNEPSHHVAYLYNYAGVPWKTQETIALIRDSLFTSKRDGICGNDDCGQMSAWYIFSTLGFYPVNPASSIYAIGTPAFEKLSIDLGNGKKFTTMAKNISKVNKYIQSATLNGKPLTASYIKHADIVNGGTLEFIMGSTPNKELWSGANAYPPDVLN